MTYNGYLFIIILNIDLTISNIEDGKLTNTEIYRTIDWICHYFRIMQQSLRKICHDGDMAEDLGCNLVLISYQLFKR